MIEKLEQSSDNILGFKLSGNIDKSDYEVIVPAVAAVIEQEGSANLLLDLTDFKWEKVSAWGADMKFGREFHEKIMRMAIVGDKKWQKGLAKIADPSQAELTSFAFNRN